MSDSRKAIFIVFAGGAIGSFMRIQCALWIYSEFLTSSASSLRVSMAAILLANVLGSLILGALWALREAKQLSVSWWLFAGIGVCGAFTTFSGLALDIFIGLHYGLWQLTGMYLLATLLLSISAAVCGYWLGRQKIWRRNAGLK